VLVELHARLLCRDIRGDLGRHLHDAEYSIAALLNAAVSDPGLLPELSHDPAVRAGHGYLGHFGRFCRLV
jgi:hypothetical protein